MVKQTLTAKVETLAANLDRLASIVERSLTNGVATITPPAPVVVDPLVNYPSFRAMVNAGDMTLEEATAMIAKRHAASAVPASALDTHGHKSTGNPPQIITYNEPTAPTLAEYLEKLDDESLRTGTFAPPHVMQFCEERWNRHTRKMERTSNTYDCAVIPLNALGNPPHKIYPGKGGSNYKALGARQAKELSNHANWLAQYAKTWVPSDTRNT